MDNNQFKKIWNDSSYRDELSGIYKEFPFWIRYYCSDIILEPQWEEILKQSKGSSSECDQAQIYAEQMYQLLLQECDRKLPEINSVEKRGEVRRLNYQAIQERYCKAPLALVETLMMCLDKERLLWSKYIAGPIQEDVDVNSDPDDNYEDTNDRDNEQNKILSPNESVSAGSSSGEPPKITGTVTQSTSQPLSSIGALTTKKRRKIREDTEIPVLQSIARSIEKSDAQQERGNAMPSTDPEITSFCSYVEQSMNKMEDNTKAIFRFRVNNLIYQAQCGALTQPQLSYSTTGIGTQNQAGPFNQMLNSWHNF